MFGLYSSMAHLLASTPAADAQATTADAQTTTADAQATTADAQATTADAQATTADALTATATATADTDFVRAATTAATSSVATATTAAIAASADTVVADVDTRPPFHPPIDWFQFVPMDLRFRYAVWQMGHSSTKNAGVSDFRAICYRMDQAATTVQLRAMCRHYGVAFPNNIHLDE